MDELAVAVQIPITKGFSAGWITQGYRNVRREN